MPKTTPKNDKSNKVKPEILDEVVEKTDIQSYVPKIKHWTKSKKTESEEKPIDLEEVIDNNELNQSMPENNTSAKDKENSKLAKLKQQVNQTKPENVKETKKTVSEIQLSQKSKQTVINKTEFDQEQTLSIPKSNSKLPSFLNRKSSVSNLVNDSQNVSAAEKITNNDHTRDPEALNSLASIFQRDQDEVSNIKRVFRKSIVFLTVSLLTFGLASLSSGNFILQSVLALGFTSLGFIALANIFFIIVAHRTYIWLFLIGQFIILMVTQYPHSFNLSTLIIGFVVILLTYLAYLDLEKVQLGSRLFSIPYIVGESTKILSSVIVFIVCLSVFNQISAKGVDKFIGDSLLSIPVVMNRVASPLYQNIVLRGSGIDYIDSSTTVKALICSSNKINCSTKSRSILKDVEYAKIDQDCKTSDTNETDCNTSKDKAEEAFLNNIKNQQLGNNSPSLTTTIDSSNYQPVVKQLIQSKIKTISDPANLSFIPSFVPTQSVIPFVISALIFVLLSVFKFILVWIGYITTWIVWKLLQVTGFVRLDIEMVEAEIVGI